MTTLLSLTSVRRGRIAVLNAEMTSPDAYDGLKTWTLASRFHYAGWDLRLMVDGHGLQLSALCRAGREMVERADEWRAAMVEKGWESC